MAFFFIPASVLTFFGWGIRPSIYVILAILSVFVFGKELRPVKNAYYSNIVAMFGLLLFASTIMAASLLFGGGSNAMLPNVWAVFPSIWIFLVPLILLEFVRYRIIKNIAKNQRFFVVLLISIVFAFVNLNELRRVFMMEGFGILGFFFESILPVLSASVLVSSVAINGSFFAVALTSFVYNLGSTFSPLLPNIDRLIWSLILYAMMFIVGILNYHLTNENSKSERKRAARVSKLTSGNAAKYIALLPSAAIIIAFFLQLFPIYPVVILTGSMTGYIDMGSLVIMRQIPADEAMARIEVGDVLHYRFREIEIVHRVIDFTYDENGTRFYITQGDANEFPDSDPLAAYDVLGTPIFTIPFVGYPNIIFRAAIGGIF